MAPSPKKTKPPSTPKNGLHAFFKPAVPSPSAPSPKVSVKKGKLDKGKGKERKKVGEGRKRKLETIELESDDDDDEEVEIVEVSKRVTRGRKLQYREPVVGIKGLKEQDARIGEVVIWDPDRGEESTTGLVIITKGEGEVKHELGTSKMEIEEPLEQALIPRPPEVQWDDTPDSPRLWPFKDEEDEDNGWGSDEEIQSRALDYQLEAEFLELSSDVEVDEEEGEEMRQGCSKDLEKVKMCPICGKKLDGMKEKVATLHINTCIDDESTLTTRKPLSIGGFTPRSSLFTKIPFIPSAAIASAASSASTRSKGKGKGNSTASDSAKLVPPTSRPLSALPSFPVPASDSRAPNAFTALMAQPLLDQEWTLAATSENTRGRLPPGEKRTVPFYKWVEGMEVTVDAFKYGKIGGCKAYFLSHAHSDHYTNLSRSWTGGKIYCSVSTANIIRLKLNVREEYLCPLEMDVVHIIGGIQVTLIDANHCPGSTMFLFEGPQTDPKSYWSKTPTRIFRYLHCGDFRASPAHLLHPSLLNKKLDTIYLDTTYLDPKYCFPAQELVIQACADLVRECVSEGRREALDLVGGKEQRLGGEAMRGWLETENKLGDLVPAEVKEEEEKKRLKKREEERWLVVVGTYSVGKERIVKAIALSLQTKIFATPQKMSLLRAQDDPLLHSLLTANPWEAQVHVVFLSDINQEKLALYRSKYLVPPIPLPGQKVHKAFTHLIGLRPTGWTYRPEATSDKTAPTVKKILEREEKRKFSPAGMVKQRDSTRECLAYGVPYSEHSSMFELTCFALSLSYNRIIPTVNIGSAASRAKMEVWFKAWEVEKKRRIAAGVGAPLARGGTYW